MKLERKKILLERAKKTLLKKFNRGEWVIFPDGTHWYPGGQTHTDSLKSLREELSKYPNPPECRVCAEGAIYLTCALDPKATTDDLAELLKHGRKRADDLFGAASIPDVNDSERYTRRHVVKLLEMDD